MKRVHVVGTADTKGPELAYIAGLVADLGHVPLVVDVGTHPSTVPVDIAAREVATHAPDGLDAVLNETDRGRAVQAMAAAYERFVLTRDDIAAVIGIGGSSGTSIVTAGMRALPIGLPKLMVSTIASGDVAPYVGVSDIVMMPSITDLAGLNRISRIVLQHAARAIVAMAGAPEVAESGKPAIGLTMFGVTTPAVTAVAAGLAETYEPLIFHATGTGGRTMEALADAGLLAGLVDLTTTEIADLLFDGVLPALPTRLDCLARRPLSYVGSLGACDMVNFWAPETMPSRYAGRLVHRHNANVTLMRTTPEECSQIGRFIAGKLNAAIGPVTFLIPEKGISALDIEGGAFHDPDADAALFAAVTETGRWSGDHKLVRLPLHINDPAFAAAAVHAFRNLME